MNKDSKTGNHIARVKCPECGIDLNPHAEKLVEPQNGEEAARMDAALGGVIEQVHTCPACGCVESKRL